MNRTKVILSIFLMLFLLLAGLVLPSFWKSQKKEASGNKGREPAKETTVCLMFSLSDQDTLPVTYHTPTGVFLFGEDGVQVSADTTVYEKQTDDSLPSLTSQDIEHLQEGGYPDTSDSPEAPDTESGSASVPSEDAKDTKKEVQP